jgi:hypothetical protein
VVTDAARRNLYTAIADALGIEQADTLMELLPPVGWADVARQSDLTALRTELKGEMAELRGGIAELRGEMRAGFVSLQAQIDVMPARLIRVNLASAIALAGLVLAAAKLA